MDLSWQWYVGSVKNRKLDPAWDVTSCLQLLCYSPYKALELFRKTKCIVKMNFSSVYVSKVYFSNACQKCIFQEMQQAWAIALLFSPQIFLWQIKVCSEVYFLRIYVSKVYFSSILPTKPCIFSDKSKCIFKRKIFSRQSLVFLWQSSRACTSPIAADGCYPLKIPSISWFSLIVSSLLPFENPLACISWFSITVSPLSERLSPAPAHEADVQADNTPTICSRGKTDENEEEI